jgi:hypothetical protein
MSNVLPRKKNSLRNLRRLFHLTVLSASFYAFMEWLFFATKPSSLSLLSAFDSLKVLLATAGTVALISIALLLVLSLPALLLSHPEQRWPLLVLGTIVPALILSITALIMLDNFTYTVFKFGIVATKGIVRGLYALGFLFFFWRMLLFAKGAVWARGKFASWLSLSLLAVSMSGILATRLSSESGLDGLNAGSRNSSARRPNIIILGSDGLSASYLSAYGSELETTPFLSKMAETSLIAENAFPNASSTTGSTTSVLTGKQAIKTKVFRYPDTLTGRDSYEHLPGILRQRGYRTVEIGTPHYVDARKLNLLEGFDIVNGQSMNSPASEALLRLLGNSPSMYFFQTISERASERLLHIFLIREMPDPLAEVEEPTERLSDAERVDQIIALLEQADQPIFIFAHLMDTHGPKFSFREQVFSSEASADEDWDKDRYRDALLSFDGHAERIYEYLLQAEQLDNTILVIYTDHGLKYTIRERLPLMIHFPENTYAGTRRNSVQNIDIPPTLLDYLGLRIPAWMDGRSLLTGEPPASREIMSTTTGSPKEIAPPFHQIKIVQVIVCEKWYALNVRKNVFEHGKIKGYTAQCDQSLLPPEEDIHQSLLEYLEKNGYDISSLH